MTEKQLRIEVRKHFENNFKIYSSDELENAIDQAIKGCCIYLDVIGDGKRKQNMFDSLKSASLNIFNSLLQQIERVKLNDSDLGNLDLFYILDIENRNEREELVDNLYEQNLIKSGFNSKVSPFLSPITIEPSLSKEHEAWSVSSFGWRRLYRPDKIKLIYSNKKADIIACMVRAGILERKTDSIYAHRQNVLHKPQKWYRINPQFLCNLEDRSNIYCPKRQIDKKEKDCFTQFGSIHTRLTEETGIGIEENMVEALNLYRLKVDVSEQQFRNYCIDNYQGKPFKHISCVSTHVVDRWVKSSVHAIKQFKEYNPRYIASCNNRRYRRSTFFNRLPRACREVICIYNGYITYDASSMHYNSLVQQFFQTDLIGGITDPEHTFLVESQGDSKSFFASKLNIERSEIGDSINKFIYSKNAVSFNMAIGKIIRNEAPVFADWVYKTKHGNKKAFVEILYPLEYRFVTALLMECTKSGIPLITIHDGVCFPAELENAFQQVANRLVEQFGITSIIRREFYASDKCEVKLIESFDTFNNCIPFSYSTMKLAS